MASEGPNSPGTVIDDSSYGAQTWTNVDDAKTSNDVYASCTQVGTSHYLKATNYSFSIPTDATINGIAVSHERLSSGSGVTDDRIRLVKAGVVGSTDRSTGATWIDVGEETITFGGETDLWGETWTPDDINASAFGVVISAIVILGTVPQVDWLGITVYYTEAAPTPTPEPPGPAPTAESAEELKYARLPNLRICDLCQNLYPPEELVEEFGYKLCRRHCYMGPKSALVSEWDDLYR